MTVCSLSRLTVAAMNAWPSLRRVVGTGVVFAMLSGCRGYAASQHTDSPASSSPPATVGLTKPAIPTKGSYLGAWVNPSGQKSTGDPQQPNNSQAELDQLPAFNAAIGAHLQILHVFSGFSAPLPNQALSHVLADGSTPLLDWGCSDVAAIASSKDDSIITSYAQGLKTFGHPVFLRWYWEMNHVDHHSNCGAGTNPAAFVSAWQHIWTIFQKQGATNVAFVWCPGGSRNTAAFYPGDRYVDWIGNDHFDDQGAPTTGTQAVTNVFGAFYQEWSGHGKPMMIGATGATPTDQPGYLQGLQAAFPTTYPAFKALMYFDAPGGNGKGPWHLQGGGVTAFGALATDPYFSFGRHS